MQDSLNLSLAKIAPSNYRGAAQGLRQMKTGVKGRASCSFFDSTLNMHQACTRDLKAFEEAHVLQ